MIVIPNTDESTATIIGIDPGSDTLGLARLTFSLFDLRIVDVSASTFHGGKLNCKRVYSNFQEDRVLRISQHEENLFRVFTTHQPMIIAAESPFYSRKHPLAFGALLEVIIAIRSAICRYDKWKVLEQYTPPIVKNAVGAGGRDKKHQVKVALSKVPELMAVLSVDFNSLDEHSVDAICVAYACYKQNVESGRWNSSAI